MDDHSCLPDNSIQTSFCMPASVMNNPPCSYPTFSKTFLPALQTGHFQSSGRSSNLTFCSRSLYNHLQAAHLHTSKSSRSPSLLTTSQPFSVHSSSRGG